MKKEFDSEPVYYEKHLKTKTIKEKSIQMFTEIKYQHKVLSTFDFQ